MSGSGSARPARLSALVGLLALEPAIPALLGDEHAGAAVPEAARAFVLAGIARLGAGPGGVVLVATPTAAEAEHLVHDLGAFLELGSVLSFPAWETLPFERVSPGAETMGRRLEVVDLLASRRFGRPGAAELPSARRGSEAPPAGSREARELRAAREAQGPSPQVVVAPVKALLQRLPPGVELRRPLVVEVGSRWRLEDLLGGLVAAGYRREYQVEHRGEVAQRGGILDIFPSTMDHGVRVDLFGDEVERLTEFDVADQRSIAVLERAVIYGCRELVLEEHERALAGELALREQFAAAQFSRLAEGELFDGMESFLPWLDGEGRILPDLLAAADKVVLVDPRRMRDRALELEDEEEALAGALAMTWGLGASAELARLHLGFERLLERCDASVTSLLASSDPTAPAIQVTGWPPALGDASVIARRVGELQRAGYRVALCADGPAGARRLAEVLRGEGLDVVQLTGSSEEAIAAAMRHPGVYSLVQPLDRGFVLESAKVAVLAEPDLTGRRRPHRQPKARRRAVEGFFDDLAPGSYVVHHVHGIARYGGMVRRAIAGAERDYLLLEYRGDDKLYVPSDQMDAITPYTGGEQPSLSRLGGGEWQRARSSARHAVREIAQELVVLYRRRLASPGHAFSPDTAWQAELEQSFPYPETPDQLRAIDEVKADMERPFPMDRLVCGDVGFGKTEVAVRAAFKAVQDNKQVAVLVPTTLLAQQHYQTFSERFAPYPMRVEMLSRFLTPAEARGVVAGIATGEVDVVVGTHALLASGIEWKDLGLLVIDEEQRFGVSHKEAVKALSVGVDVLTLTASPIPRTLEMGLTGIRDLSVIDTPPAERQPILTYVGELDERAIAEAIRRELLREGQAFFVHNRVQDIERVAVELSSLVPEARVAVAHGQLDEGSLERVVLDFADGKYDVLVCTTIVESGIDMPNVNTLVVDRADRLGLGQLHQLRGRVGRSGQRAYAYLFHPADRVLSEQAYERLRTIGELTDLGSGFKIAMRDLEIRGAGNLLGSDQSGHIAAMGYDLYVRMVAEAVAELKGGEIPEPAVVKLELPVDANLPASYVSREDLRLEAYRRLALVRDPKGVEDIGAEWADRYGPLPAAAEALLGIARLRAECVRAGVREVSVVATKPGTPGPARFGELVARISPVTLRASQRVRLARRFPRALFKEEASQLVVPIGSGEPIAVALTSLLAELVPDEAPPGLARDGVST